MTPCTNPPAHSLHHAHPPSHIRNGKLGDEEIAACFENSCALPDALMASKNTSAPSASTPSAAAVLACATENPDAEQVELPSTCGDAVAKGRDKNPINEIRMMCTTNNSGVPLHVLQWFAKAVDQRIWSIYSGAYAKNPIPSVRLGPDQGLENLLVDKNDKLYLSPKAGTWTISLWYVGQVTRVPSEKNIPVCWACGTQFYVDGMGFGKCQTMQQCEKCVPALLVPMAHVVPAAKVKKGKPKTEPKPASVMNKIIIDVQCKIVPFEFQYTLGVKNQKIKTDLSLHQLVLTLSKDTLSEEAMPLYRPRTVDPYIEAERLKSELISLRASIGVFKRKEAEEKQTCPPELKAWAHMFK